MPRSNWKLINSNTLKNNYTFSREYIILPKWIGKTINVYQGKHFIPVHITSLHVGHKLGEFSFTKYPAKYKVKLKN